MIGLRLFDSNDVICLQKNIRISSNHLKSKHNQALEIIYILFLSNRMFITMDLRNKELSYYHHK